MPWRWKHFAEAGDELRQPLRGDGASSTNVTGLRSPGMPYSSGMAALRRSQSGSRIAGVERRHRRGQPGRAAAAGAASSSTRSATSAGVVAAELDHEQRRRPARGPRPSCPCSARLLAGEVDQHAGPSARPPTGRVPGTRPGRPARRRASRTAARAGRGASAAARGQLRLGDDRERALAADEQGNERCVASPARERRCAVRDRSIRLRSGSPQQSGQVVAAHPPQDVREAAARSRRRCSRTTASAAR